MHTTEPMNEREKAVLVALHLQGTTQSDVERSMGELTALADTAGADVVRSVVQSRDLPDMTLFLGKGKAQEVAAIVEETEATLVIADAELSPVQIRNLEGVVGVRVIDRSQLILDIFALRARSREAKLQVELAQCEYALPRLTGRGRSMSRTAAGIGARGPGETKLEMDRRRLRNRMSDIRRELAEVRKHRELHRRQRERVGVPVVALVGYTNAGKSSLFNAICRQFGGATHDVVEAENRLFKTLDTTVRRIDVADRSFLITDTVGFIQHLPHHLVAAFRSTLEEVVFADLLIHVIDASQYDATLCVDVVDRTLSDLGCRDKPMILVGNKSDLPVASDAGTLPIAVRTSAVTMEGVDVLVERIQNHFYRPNVYAIRIPYDQPERMAQLYRFGEVVDRQEGETYWDCRVILSQQMATEFHVDIEGKV